MNFDEHDLNRLARKLWQLMQENTQADHGVWVKVRQLAKAYEGVDQPSPLVEAAIQTPDYARYFDFLERNKIVKLSDAGKELLSSHNQSEGIPMGYRLEAIARDYSRSLKPLIIKVQGVDSIRETDNHRYVHSIIPQMSEETFVNNVPVTLFPRDGTGYEGKIVGSENDYSRLYISFGVKISHDRFPAQLKIDQAFLTMQIAKRWREVSDAEEILNRIKQPQYNQTPIQDDDSCRVAQLLAQLKSDWTRFLWGPPGGGKTFAIAKLILLLLSKNKSERILVIAPSNRAVDVLTEELISLVKSSGLEEKLLESRKILRYGYPKTNAVLQEARILGSKQFDGLNDRNKQLSNEIAELQNSTNQIEKIALKRAVMRAEILEVQEKITKSIGEHACDVNILLSTSAQLYLDKSPIWPQKTWDTVIVDEVTMVPPIVCGLAASLRSKRMLFVGDARQLGPVFKENSQSTEDVRKWFGKSIFAFAGLESAIESQHYGDSRLCKITAQRRCPDTIWKQVKHLYPNVKSNFGLASAATIKVVHKNDVVPSGIQLCDSREFRKATCSKDHRSWNNDETAKLCVALALNEIETAASSSIAIITPYRAQVKTIKSVLSQYDSNNIECGTIHQFQGSEADVVIFDIVDGRPRTQIGKLLSGDQGLRLVTVAITRAKRKVILVGDVEWLKQKLTPNSNSLLYALVHGCRNYYLK